MQSPPSTYAHSLLMLLQGVSQNKYEPEETEESKIKFSKINALILMGLKELVIAYYRIQQNLMKLPEDFRKQSPCCHSVDSLKSMGLTEKALEKKIKDLF